MRLVETDAVLAGDEAAPAEVPLSPRPEHRKAYVSLVVTFAVLVGTVAIVYSLFPKRNHEVIEQAIEAHRAPGSPDLVRPSAAELAAWTIGVLAKPVPWPTGPGLTVTDVRQVSLLRRPAAMARYDVAGTPVTLFAMIPWDAPARTIRLADGDVVATWWRKGPFTFIAIGPSSDAAWRRPLGAP